MHEIGSTLPLSASGGTEGSPGCVGSVGCIRENAVKNANIPHFIRGKEDPGPGSMVALAALGMDEA